jgi:hypothetical protein
MSSLKSWITKFGVLERFKHNDFEPRKVMQPNTGHEGILCQFFSEQQLCEDKLQTFTSTYGDFGYDCFSYVRVTGSVSASGRVVFFVPCFSERLLKKRWRLLLSAQLSGDYQEFMDKFLNMWAQEDAIRFGVAPVELPQLPDEVPIDIFLARFGVDEAELEPNCPERVARGVLLLQSVPLSFNRNANDLMDAFSASPLAANGWECVVWDVEVQKSRRAVFFIPCTCDEEIQECVRNLEAQLAANPACFDIGDFYHWCMDPVEEEDGEVEQSARKRLKFESE